MPHKFFHPMKPPRLEVQVTHTILIPWSPRQKIAVGQYYYLYHPKPVDRVARHRVIKLLRSDFFDFYVSRAIQTNLINLQ
jgi:hypothetical protein